jgi:WD40 repeat protein
MSWPTSQDYNEAIQNAATSFSDPSLKSGEVVVNAIGLPVPRSGNFADVYQFKGGDRKMWALKCFTRKVAGLQERYAKIDEHIAKANFPFTVGFKYFAQGIRVHNEWFPLLKMEWVEGFTLNEFVRNNAGKAQYLHGLMQMWAKLTARLRDSNFAHADLQHGNVLLVPGDSPNKLGLRLIDYDGMWVPALADTHSGEIGHPNFQHPLRLKDRLYNADVDRFPHLVIASALRATLIGGRELWDRFDNGDNLLFKENDLRDLANSTVVKALWDLKDDVLCTLIGKLALAAKEPLRKTPWLDDLLLTEEGQRLGDEEEKKVVDLLGVKPHFSARKSAAVPANALSLSEFSDFGSDDQGADGRGRVSPARPIKRPQKRRVEELEELPEEESKSRLPWIIGGAVLAVALIGGGIIAMTSGGKKPKTELTKNDVDAEPPPKTVAPPPNKGKTDESAPPKKDPPQVKKEAPAVVSNDPPGDEKIIPVEPKKEPAKPGPITFVTKTAVVGIAPIPRSSDILFLLKDDPFLHRCSFEQKRIFAVGKQVAPRLVACSPDGNFAVSAGGDNALRVWSLNDSRELFVLKEHTQPIVACAVSPDNDRAVSIGMDSHLCEWNLKDGNLIRKSPIPASLSVAYLPDGKSVLIGTAGESGMVFDLDKQQRSLALPGHKGKVNAVCVSTDGRRGFTAGDDFAVRVWDLATGQQLRALIKHASPIIGLAETSNGGPLFSADEDGQVYLWNPKSLGLGGAHKYPPEIRCLAVTGTGEMMVLGIGENSGGGKIRFLNINIHEQVNVVKKGPDDGKPIGKIEELWSTKGISSGTISFAPDSSKVGLSNPGGMFSVSPVKNGPAFIADRFAEKLGGRCQFCADGKYLVSFFGNKIDQQIYGWDPQTKTRLFSIEDEAAYPPAVMTIAPTANVLFLALKSGGLGVYSLADGKKSETLELPGAGRIIGLCCTADGEAILVHALPGVSYFRSKKGLPFKTLPANVAGQSLALSADAKSYVQYGAGPPGTFRICDTTTGTFKTIETGDPTPIRCAGFTSDGRHAVSIADNMMHMWNVETGAEVKQASLAGRVLAAAISPDGLYAATTSFGVQTFQLWRLSDGDSPAIAKNDPAGVSPPPDPKLETKKKSASDVKEGLAATSKELTDRIAACFYSGDGKKIYAATQSGAVHILDALTLDETQKFNVVDGKVEHAIRVPKTMPAPNPPKDLIYAFDDQKHLRILDLDKGSAIRDLPFAPILNDAPTARYTYHLLIAPDGHTLFLQSARRAVAWDMTRNQSAEILPLARPVFKTATRALAFSSDGRFGAAATTSNLLVWNAKTGTDIRLIPCRLTTHIAFAPESNIVVSGGAQQFSAWDFIAGKELWSAKPDAPVIALQSIPKTNRIVYSTFSEIVIRDCLTGEDVLRWRSPENGAQLAVSSDGKYVASFGVTDNRVRLWALPAVPGKKGQ